jgi:Ca2+-binding EF-hand superfamily protein
VDLSAVRQAKELKQAMIQRLKQIDFDNSGLITLDSLIAISSKYGIQLGNSDIQLIKEKYRIAPAQVSQACKVDYYRVLNDIKMKIDSEGKI